MGITKPLSVGSFLLAPAIPALSAGVAFGAVASAVGAIADAPTVRNLMANPVKNQSLNPHMNPHMATDKFNLAAKKASGGIVKTFMDVIKARIKG